jgi:hypothetical protein
MRWSKLKQMVESRMAISLGGRIELHSARYRHAHDSDGRVWLTVDGREVVSVSYHRTAAIRYNIARGLREANAHVVASDPAFRAEFQDGWAPAKAITRKQGIVTQFEFYDDLEEYLSLTVEQAWESPNPLIRALAIVDRRLGKRRLRSLSPDALDHPLMRELYDLRCVAEGIEHDSTSSGSA